MNLCAHTSQSPRPSRLRLQRAESKLWRILGNQPPLRLRCESFEVSGEPFAFLLCFSEVFLGHAFPMRHSGVESRSAAFDRAATDIVAVSVAHG
jgi:hypothetical protein